MQGPHLTYGCETALDVRPSALTAMETTQKTFLRRALGLGSHSQVAPLFTETGVWPLRYCRAALALRFLAYIYLPGAAASAACRSQGVLRARPERAHLVVGRPLPCTRIAGCSSARTREPTPNCRKPGGA